MKIFFLKQKIIFKINFFRKSDEKYENIKSSESLNNISRFDSNYGNQRNVFDNDGYSQNANNLNSDQYTVSTTSRQLDPELRKNLNLPQQYEATIN